jgi:hypothetical protein
MSNFSVGCTSRTHSLYALGQSLTPNVAGPSGTGGPGTANPVYLQSLIVGYPDSDTDNRAASCFVYSAPLDDPDKIGSPTNLVATSNSTSDGSAFGSNSHTRTFNFLGSALNPAGKYYAYFSAVQTASCTPGSPYSGGQLYDDDMGATADCMQFLANMTTSHAE